jgi:hypothetical protein
MRIICIVGGDVNCQKHVGGSGEDPCTALPGGGGGQRILFQVSHQDRGRGVPPPPRQPYPHGGDSPWIPCPGVHLQHQGETYLARPSGLSPITARPLITILRTVAYETIMRAYRYQLYPSTSQTTLLEQTLEICRWVYNDTLSDRVHSCPHCGLVMDRDQNAGVQYYEIGAAVSGITSQDAHDERRGSSHKNCATISG